MRHRFWIGIALLLAFAYTLPVRAQTVSATHPRVWLTPARLTLLKNYAARNTPRWQKVLAAANAALTNSNATIWGDDGAGVELGLAYQVTGNVAYAQRDIQLLVAEAVSSNDLSQGGAWWGYRYLPDYIAAYDWCYDQMTTAQRQQVAKWLMDRADAVWPETNSARNGGWGLWPSNNYYWGFMFTCPAALAAYGDDPTTSGTVSSPNRPLYHINLGLTHWKNDVLPWANSWGVGGMFAESTGYDSTNYVAMIADGYLTAYGTDLVNNGGTTFLHDSMLWRLHSTTPTLDRYYPLGDRPTSPGAWLSDWDRWRMCVPMTDTTDTVLQPYGKDWLNTITPSLDTTSIMCGYDFLYYNEDAASMDYTKSLPLWYYASGPGILLRRSGWTSTASYFGIWAGPNAEAHQDMDVNGFQIFKGNWLAGAASLWSNSGEIEATNSHNNLTFSGADQTWQNPGPGGQMLKEENTAEYSYFAGQAAPAYLNGTNPVTDYVRKFVYVPGDAYVVFDRVKLTSGSLTKEWHLQCANAPVISGRNFTAANGAYQINGQSLLPASGVTLAKVSMSSQTSGNSTGYRVDVNTADGLATDYLLNVLQLTPTGTAATPAQLITASTGNMDGALMPASGFVVMCGTSELVSGPVTYSETCSITTHHLVLDLTPLTNYQITLTNLTTNGTNTLSQMTSSQGSLRFDVPAGGYSVTISSGGVAQPPTLSGLTLNPTSVTGGTASQGTVILSGVAPTNGLTVTLSSSNTSAATVPASVIVPAGTASATFPVTTYAVTANTSATISATYSGLTQTATLTVLAPTALTSVSVSPSSLTGGATTQGTVTLNNQAPSNGAVVTLSSSNTSAATVLANVTVPAGATSATFTVNTSAVTANTTVIISASYQNVTQTANVTVQPPPQGGISGWPSTTVPSNPDENDNSAVELGVKFRTDVAGYITGVRFYKGSTNTGTHIGSLWSRTGQLLAQATFTNETASGWQQVTFSQPVAIAANTTYVASYHTNTGYYAETDNFFTNSGVDNPPLHLLQDGVDGSNGVYLYGAGGFPTQGYEASNYWVDVVFSTSTSAASPTVTAVSPASGAALVALSTTVNVTFSKAMDPSTITTSTILLQDPNKNTVTATVTYNASTNTATLQPASSLNAATTYAAIVKGGTTGSVVKDTSGNAMAANYSWSFTTVAATTLGGITLNPGSVNGSTTTLATVTLNTAAPTGGAVVTLSSNNVAATVPASVTVPAGKSTVSFTVQTKTVTANTPVTLSAAYKGVTKTTSLTVLAPVKTTPSGFVLGINLGGNTAVTIEGNPWIAYNTALASGLSVTNAQADPTSPVTYSPTPDANTATMLNSCLWTSATPNGGSFTLNQKLSNGSYKVYVWEVEDGSDHAHSFNLLLQGSQVATGIGNQLKGQWQKYGPYAATVSNGVLTLKVVSTKSVPQLMGLAIFTK
jgi:hypothetical protein